MSLLDLASCRSLVQTDLTDPALQILIDAAEDEISNRIGTPAGPITYTKERMDLSLQTVNIIFLPRPAASITTITEVWGDEFSETTTVLAVNDYRILYNGLALERLGNGTNQRWLWGHRVTIVYVPVDDTKRRKGVISELVRLATRYSGVRSQGEGVTAETSFESYIAERDALISSLVSGFSFS